MSSTQFPLTYRQPFKAIYVASRLLSLVVLIPSWIIYYTIFPRPRKSWTLRQTIGVRLIRWIMPLNAACGLSPLRTDKTREVPQSELKETTFTWIEPADASLIRGIAKDDKIKPTRIPGYVWPKGATLGQDDGFVGLWIHGGGYMMGNGLESFHEADIARQIVNNSEVKTVLSVEYRLVDEGCHPAQLLDALAAYAQLTNVMKIDPSRIIVFGACAGGHLTLLLLRYLYEEKVLPLPRAIMLFSPWVDMAIDKESQQNPSICRPNIACDMLATSYLANLRFLGHHSPDIFDSPYLSANRTPSGNFKGYPKVFISVGDAEAFQRECDQLVERLQDDGVDVTYDVQEDAVHDFWGSGSLVPHDEARTRVAEHVYRWINGLKTPNMPNPSQEV